MADEAVGANMLELLSTGELSDFCLRAFGETYQLHRAPLAASAFFRRLFKGPWTVGNKAPFGDDFSDFCKDDLQDCLRYLYGGALGIAALTCQQDDPCGQWLFQTGDGAYIMHIKQGEDVSLLLFLCPRGELLIGIV